MAGRFSSHPGGRPTIGEPTAVGQRAEQAALRFLAKSGLTLVARNYRCRWGEIDLILKDSACLVFVEVRYRRSSGFGRAAASVSGQKQHRLISAAAHYLSHNASLKHMPTRFDVIGIDYAGRQRTVEWIPDAFRPGD